PARHAAAQVHAVGVQVHLDRSSQALEGLDRRHQLHPVISGRPGITAVELLLASAVAQDRAPAARARVAAARAVGADHHNFFGAPHGLSPRGRTNDAAAPTRPMTRARTNTTASPSWNGIAIRWGKNWRPVRMAAFAAGRWFTTAGPSSCWMGL